MLRFAMQGGHKIGHSVTELRNFEVYYKLVSDVLLVQHTGNRLAVLMPNQLYKNPENRKSDGIEFVLQFPSSTSNRQVRLGTAYQVAKL